MMIVRNVEIGYYALFFGEIIVKLYKENHRMYLDAQIHPAISSLRNCNCYSVFSAADKEADKENETLLGRTGKYYGNDYLARQAPKEGS